MFYCSYEVFDRAKFCSLIYSFADTSFSLMESEQQSILLLLPEAILVNIFSMIPLSELLHSVSRTCKTLHSVVEKNSVLWKDIDFSVDHAVDYTTLLRILKHSFGFQTFFIPFVEIACEAYYIDFAFTTNLCNAKNLYWIDISRCRISTLCFLKFLPRIEILNVSECNNLVDADFRVISTCTTLDQLYLSYTNISATTAVDICSALDLIVLDLSGIKLSINQCDALLKPSLLIFQVSFHPGESDQEIELLKLRHRDCSIKSVE